MTTHVQNDVPIRKMIYLVLVTKYVPLDEVLLWKKLKTNKQTKIQSSEEASIEDKLTSHIDI